MEPCPRCQAPFVTEKLTKRSGTVRRCAREGCGWQARLDEDDGRWVEMADQPRAAAKTGRVPRRPSRAGGGAAAAGAGPGKKAAAKAVAAKPGRAKPARKKPARRKTAGGARRTAAKGSEEHATP